MTRRCVAPARAHAPSFIALLCIALGTVSLYRSISCRAAEAADPSREDRLRAGYLFNFAKFIEWPTFMPEAPLTVCFLGSTGIHAAFDADMGGKLIGTHRLLTREVRSRTAATGCQMVFVGASSTAVADNLTSTIVPATLTVGDAPDFLARGGIIELFTQDNRLRFNVSTANARQANLRIGSDLLQLAAHVEETKQ